MANSIVRMPLGYFGDPSKGRPLFNAKIYIGKPDLDPRIVVNRLTVTGRQENGTEIPLAQPVRTNSGGYPVNDSGSSVVTLLVDGAYSLAVDNRQDNEEYYFANVLDGAPLTTESVAASDQLNDALVTATGTTTPRSLADRAVDVLYIEDFGAAADAVLAADGSENLDTGTDNLSAFNLAIALAGDPINNQKSSGKVIDLNGGKFGISGPIQIDKRFNGITITNGTIVALPSWTGGSGDALVMVGDGSTGSDQVWGINLEKINFVCRRRTSAVRFHGSQKCSITLCRGVGFTEFGARSDSVSGELKLSRVSMYEYEFTDTRNNKYANRTAAAYFMNSADFAMSDCVGAVSKYGFLSEAGYNFQVSNCHFWVGLLNDAPDSGNTPLIYLNGGRSGNFDNIYLDEGIIAIREDFNYTFDTILAAQGTYGNTNIVFDLISTTVGQQAERLIINNVRSDRFSNNVIRHSVEGAGTWDRYKHIITNLTLSGTNVDTIHPHQKVRLLGSGSTVHTTDDSDKYASVTVGNMVPSFHSLGTNYSRTTAVTSFSTDGLQFPSFITASCPSGEVGDFNGFHGAGEIIGQFWSLTSDGTNFGDGAKQYKGGGGIKVVTTELHTSSALGTKVEVHSTTNSSTTAALKYTLDTEAITPSGNILRSLGKQFLRWVSVWTEKVNFGGSNVFDSYGSGSPEGVLTADRGSTYRRTDGGAGTSFYIKESGAGNTGWVAK